MRQTHAVFGAQLHGGLEQVHHEPQFVGVQVVHDGEEFGRVVALPSEDLADMGPVLRFDGGIVVFFVGPAAGELKAAFLAVAVQVVIDEFRAIVGVDVLQRTP